MKHEKRIVGHASGWQEFTGECVCGKQWPCPDGTPQSSNPAGLVKLFWDSETRNLRETPTRHGWHTELYRAKDVDAEIARLTQAVADKESDVARLHNALMDLKYPETKQVETTAPVTYSHACALLTEYAVAVQDRYCCGDELQPALDKALKACTDAMGVQPELNIYHCNICGGDVSFPAGAKPSMSIGPGNKTRRAEKTSGDPA